jgi:two-component system, OmpR family, sensor histidine kinase VanS
LKSDFTRLKRKIFLQVIAAALLTGVVGFLISKLLIDGLLQDPFARWFINLCENLLNVNEKTAVTLYQQLFRQNKGFLLMSGFIILLLVFFYITMSRFTRYFDQINGGVYKLLDESGEEIFLSPELSFMESNLNTVKNTLEKRKKAALESEQRKNDLVVYLAHDIKTPLTSIVGYLSLLEEAPDMPLEQRAKYTSITLEKALRLEELINEFFEITRFNLQNITLEKEDINLHLLLEQLADEFYPVLAPKNKRAVVEVDEDIILHGDANKLARVFNNILKNAAAYSDENSVIEIKAEKQNHNIFIKFKNSGKPIPSHKLNTIFEKFYRLDSARSSNTGGSGLGLAIAKEIVEAHSGTITAASSEEFTEFVVTLPL